MMDFALFMGQVFLILFNALFAYIAFVALVALTVYLYKSWQDYRNRRRGASWLQKD